MQHEYRREAAVDAATTNAPRCIQSLAFVIVLKILQSFGYVVCLFCLSRVTSGQAPSADEGVELEDADGEDEDNDCGGEKKKKCVTAGRKSTVTTVKKIAAPEKAGRSQSARGKSSTGERKQLKRNPTGAALKGLDDTDGDKTPTGNTPKNASKEGKKAGEG
eukprot:g12963.t1